MAVLVFGMHHHHLVAEEPQDQPGHRLGGRQRQFQGVGVVGEHDAVVPERDLSALLACALP